MKTWFSLNWLKLAAIAMVLGAINTSFPYAYYQFMNWVVVGAALVTVTQAYQRRHGILIWVFALVAVVFNPLSPIFLRQDIWRMVDIATAALFIISFAIILPKKTGQKE